MLSSPGDTYRATLILTRGAEAISNRNQMRDVAEDERLTPMPPWAPPTKGLLLSPDKSAAASLTCWEGGRREKYLESEERVPHFHLCTLINQPTSDGTRQTGVGLSVAGK